MKKIIAILILLALLLTGVSCTESEPGYGNVRIIDENSVPRGIEVIDDHLTVAVTPYYNEIARGLVSGQSSINKFGENGAVGGVLETIWSGSDLYTYMPDAGDQLEILSSSVADNVSLTGAWTLELIGFDVNKLPISENVSMNGTTVVTSVLTYTRIPRAIIRTAGSTGWNVGTITIREQDTDETRQIILPFKNQTLFGGDTCPADSTCWIVSWYVGAVASKDTQIELYIRPPGEVFQVKRNIHLSNAAYMKKFDFPERVEGGGDIEMRAIATGGGGDVSAGFFMLIIKD